MDDDNDLKCQCCRQGIGSVYTLIGLICRVCAVKAGNQSKPISIRNSKNKTEGHKIRNNKAFHEYR